MKNKQIFLFAFIIILFVLLFTLGSKVNSKTLASRGDTIKVGVLLPLTGPAEPTGIKLKYAIEVAEEIINGEYPEIDLELGRESGLPNLDNKRVKFIYADHKSSPETARNEAERLIKEEHVSALIGAYHSSATKSASQVSEEYKIPFLAGSSSSASLTKRGMKYFSRIAPDDDMETELFFEYLKYLNKSLDAKIKTVGVVCIDNEYGVHASEMIDKWLDEKYISEGFEKVVEIRYSEDLDNIDLAISKIKELEPDVIFQASYIEDVTEFVRKYKENKIIPKVVLNYCGGFQDPQFVDNLGEDGNYFSGSSASMPSIIENIVSANKINKLYKEKSGEDIDGPALEEFASAMIISNAINSAGTTDGDRIMDILKNKLFRTPYFTSGYVEFDSNGQNSRSISFVVQLQEGKYEVVWPLNIQNKEPQILSHKWGN